MRSPSLFLGPSTTFFSLATLSGLTSALPQDFVERQGATSPARTYSLLKEHAGPTFFDDFYFFPDADLTHGYVTYGDRNHAQSHGLIGFDGDYAVLGVDSTTVLEKTTDYWNVNKIGRRSVRIESTTTFNHGLVTADIGGIPSGCGMWPAFWTLGQEEWPTDGEIDIIEGTNAQEGNFMALHTNIEGTISQSAPMAGTVDANAPDCGVRLHSANPNWVGCKINDSDSTTFKDYQGGVWAMQWTSEAIKMWYWPYSSVPNSAQSDTPVVGEDWGAPRAVFGSSSSLDIDGNFRNHHVIFDTTFCGDFAESTWGSLTDTTNSCARMTGYAKCADFVAHNPQYFSDAKWKIKYVKIFEEHVASATSSSTTTSPTSTTSSISTTTYKGGFYSYDWLNFYLWNR